MKRICFRHIILNKFIINFILFDITRTKTSIRYAKKNDKRKREGRKERERKVEGEI